MKSCLMLVCCFWLVHVDAATDAVLPLDCPLSIEGTSLPVVCEVRLQPPEPDGYNLVLSATIDLQPLIDAFPKLLASAVDRNDCRDRAKVQQARLSIDNGDVVADARIWIEKRICEGPLKTRIFEKTGNVAVRFKPVVTARHARLEATVEASGLSDFEEDVAKVVGLDARALLKRALDGKLRVHVDDVGLPPELASSVTIRSAQLHATPPRLVAELSANLDTGTLVELLNLWRSAAVK